MLETMSAGSASTEASGMHSSKIISHHDDPVTRRATNFRRVEIASVVIASASGMMLLAENIARSNGMVLPAALAGVVLAIGGAFGYFVAR